MLFLSTDDLLILDTYLYSG